MLKSYEKTTFVLSLWCGKSRVTMLRRGAHLVIRRLLFVNYSYQKTAYIKSQSGKTTGGKLTFSQQKSSDISPKNHVFSQKLTFCHALAYVLRCDT